jgi:hypothetical protein
MQRNEKVFQTGYYLTPFIRNSYKKFHLNILDYNLIENLFSTSIHFLSFFFN